jgi:hydroxypyruvate isomerase
MPIRQSVVLPTFGSGIKAGMDNLDPLKAVGFDAIEIWTRDNDYAELFEAARSRGFAIASMVGHEHRSEKDGGLAEGFSRRANHDRLEAELRESIDIAAEWNMPGLIVLSGHRNPNESDYESMLVCAKGLRRIAPYAEEKGVNLNMELLNTTVDHPHYLCDSTDWAVAVCELVNSPRVKILYDIYHMQIMEGNLITNINRAARWIGHYHTAGVPGRHELDDQQEINYPGVCRAINKTGYDLFLGHELFARGNQLDALRQAYAICNV